MNGRVVSDSCDLVEDTGLTHDNAYIRDDVSVQSKEILQCRLVEARRKIEHACEQSVRVSGYGKPKSSLTLDLQTSLRTVSWSESESMGGGLCEEVEETAGEVVEARDCCALKCLCATDAACCKFRHNPSTTTSSIQTARMRLRPCVLKALRA